MNFEKKTLAFEKPDNSEKVDTSIYIHIPFCKQACHYCDFHFSTSLQKKDELIIALCKELVIRKDELPGIVNTVYFGGGTPSLLSAQEIKTIIDAVYTNFEVCDNPEITLEANPDDLSEEKIKELSETPINRLSIGIQSFFEDDLKMMNRAHNSSEAFSCIKNAKIYFENISIDLIYGIPGMTNARWKENLQIALDFEVPHLSSYALTVEPRTALKKFIDKGIIAPVDDAVAKEHYEILVETAEKAGYDNYEFSNFSKPGFFSRNNTAYWEAKSYLGIGPSAHSYSGNSRSWNISNNTIYIKSIAEGKLPIEREILSVEDKYNEYIMTASRTKKGIVLEKVELDFGKEYLEYLLSQAIEHLEDGLLEKENDIIRISKKGKFLGDGIASDLFWI